jgi:hypothetical protein
MFNKYCTSIMSNSMASTSNKHIRWSGSVYGEYVCGLVSNCHGRLGQDDAIQVKEGEEFDGGRD